MFRRTFIGSGIAATLPLPAIAIEPSIEKWINAVPSVEEACRALKAKLMIGEDIGAQFVQPLDVGWSGDNRCQKYAFVDTVLENTIRDLICCSPPWTVEYACQQLRTAYGVATNMLCHDLIGVHAISASVDHVYVLRYRKEVQLLPDTTYRGMITMMKHKATSKTRRLAGSDISTADAVRQIDREMVDRLYQLADHNHGIEANSRAYVDAILAQAEQIEHYTRRGRGNWCIVSPTVFNDIISPNSRFQLDHDSLLFTPLTGVRFVGKLSYVINVYVDGDANEFTPTLVGYYGSNFDAAVFYAGYTPFFSDLTRYDWLEPEPMYSTILSKVSHIPMEFSYDVRPADYLGLVDLI